MKAISVFAVLSILTVDAYSFSPKREKIIASDRAQCTIPEAVSIKVAYTRIPLDAPPKEPYQVYADFVTVTMLVENSGTDRWTFDLRKSSVKCQEQAWQSVWVDNYSDRPSQEQMPIDPGKTMLKLYPKALLRETDAEIHDTRWFDWPQSNLQFNFVLVDNEGKEFDCIIK